VALAQIFSMVAAADVFIFEGEFGDDIITDISIDGNIRELIDLSAFNIFSVATQLAGKITDDSAGNAVIELDNGTITLLGVASNEIPLNILVQNEGQLLIGTNGADTLNGGLGNDLIEGLDGDDFIDAGPNLPATINRPFPIPGDGDDTIFGGGGNDTITDIGGSDHIDGGDGDDLIVLGINAFTGVNDRDTVFGGAGNDTLNGFNNNINVLDGGSGDDILIGSQAGDTLIGGNGNDVLSGNNLIMITADRSFDQRDHFIFADGFGNDIIVDFDTRSNFFRNDQLDLSAVTNITDFDDLVANHLFIDIFGNAVITDDSNTITLQGVSSDSLMAGDFIF